MSSAYKINFAIVGAVLLACPTQSKAITGIVPGHSLGKIAIGESRKNVLSIFPNGPTDNYDLKHGLIEDEWTTHIINKNGTSSLVSVSVWYKQEKVVQVELCNQSESIPKLPSFNTLISNNKNLKKLCYSMGCYSQGGEYAGGYILFYYDDIKDGVAYGEGVQDDFILTVKPEYVTVHTPGTPVIPVRGFTNVTVVKGRDTVTYRTQAEAESAERKASMRDSHTARDKKRN